MVVWINGFVELSFAVEDLLTYDIFGGVLGVWEPHNGGWMLESWLHVSCDFAKIFLESADIVVPVAWHAEGIGNEDRPESITHFVKDLIDSHLVCLH